MSRHEGVSCDSCMRTNFRGKRYKCLVCYDYDLCETCYESSLTSNTQTSSESNRSNHTNDHAMQCMLTQLAYDLFYTGETSGGTQTLQSITCPICGSLGYTEQTLITHVSQAHPSHSHEVVCPLCATLPNGDPNFVTEDYARHLARAHNTSRTPNANNGEEERAASNMGLSFTRRRGGATSASGNNSSNVFASTGRAILRRRNGGVLNLTSSNSATTSVGPGSGSANNANTTTVNAQPPVTSANVRESVVDPIAELLSQLSGVRRAGARAGNNAEHQAVLNSTASHLQQLQWQLQMERQNLSAGGGTGGGGSHSRAENLSRIPRRSYGASSYSAQSSVSASGYAGGGGAGGGASEVIISAGSGTSAAGAANNLRGSIVIAADGFPVNSGPVAPLFNIDLLSDSRFMLRGYNPDSNRLSEEDKEMATTTGEQPKSRAQSGENLPTTAASATTSVAVQPIKTAEATDIGNDKLDFVHDLTFSLLQLDAGDPMAPLEFVTTNSDTKVAESSETNSSAGVVELKENCTNLNGSKSVQISDKDEENKL